MSLILNTIVESVVDTTVDAEDNESEDPEAEENFVQLVNKILANYPIFRDVLSSLNDNEQWKNSLKEVIKYNSIIADAKERIKEEVCRQMCVFVLVWIYTQKNKVGEVTTTSEAEFRKLVLTYVLAKANRDWGAYVREKIKLIYDLVTNKNFCLCLCE